MFMAAFQTRDIRLSARATLWVLPTAVVCTAACLPPPHMKLSAASRKTDRQPVWWAMPPETSLGGPVVGVEQPLGTGCVRQWLIDDCGVRCFRYDHGSCRCGPPVGDQTLAGDFELVGSLVRARFGRPADAWPGPPLPPDRIQGMHDAADLVALLDECWPDSRTEPPPLTTHEIRQAMEAAEIGVGDMLKAGS